LTGLTASTKYHYRLVATNASGTTWGADKTFTTSGVYSGAVLGTSGLVSYWRLGESSGVTAADGKGANGGTYVGGPTLGLPGAISGDPDTAVGFNGTNQYVGVPYVAALNPSVFTVEAWANVTGGAGTYRAVVGSRSSQVSGYTVYASASDTWQFFLGNGSGWQAVDGGPIVSGWHHVVGTYDGTTERLYVDGVLAGSKAASLIPNSSQTFTIGMNDGGWSYPFVGNIDEVAVYNAALSASTIQNHYNLGH
jgi:hypothetical protein